MKHTTRSRLKSSKSIALFLVIVVLSGLWRPQAARAELSAKVDATVVTTEQSLRLVLTSDLANHSNSSPDFSELSKDFEVLGSSSQTNLQTIGQKMTQTRSWQLELLAKRTGTLTIPVFTLDGEQSEPIQITATAAKQRKPGDAKGDYYMEASVDRTSAYVQSQILYTLRIFSVQNFLEGSLSEVEAEEVTVQELGDSRDYQEIINGRAYKVLEKKYALIPQRSGEITIPPVQLVARVPVRGSANRGFFTPSQTIRLHSEGFDLTVLPRPESSGNDWWLPATSVELSSQWDGDVTSLRVGDSVTRSLLLVADGVSSSLLPEINQPQGVDYKLYANQPQLEEQVAAEGLRALRQEKWAIVALKPGELTLPPIEVPWFNTRTGTNEVAVLAGETLQILPSPQTDTHSDDDATGANKATADSGKDVDPTTDPLPGAQNSAMLNTTLAAMSTRISRWQRITTFVSLGWLATLLAAAWYWWHRRAKSAGSVTRSSRQPPSLQSLRRACDAGDAPGSAKALMAWAREFWPENPPRTLVSLSQRLHSVELEKHLKWLDSHLYSSKSDAISGTASNKDVLAALAASMSDAIAQEPNATRKKTKQVRSPHSALPDL